MALLLPGSKTNVLITGISDDYGTNKQDIPNGGNTDDRTPTITGTLSTKLLSSEKILVKLSDGSKIISGYATVSGTTWFYVPTLPSQPNVKYSVTAYVEKALSVPGIVSSPRTFTFGTEVVPTITPPNPSTTITTSTSTISELTDLWNTKGTTAFNLNKFIGFADEGPGIYDTGVGGINSPKPLVLNKEVYKDHSVKIPFVGTIGAGIGAGIKASAKAGLDVNITASLGSAKLFLNDAIKWSWNKKDGNIILKSYYDELQSTANVLNVKGPSLQLGLKAGASVNLDAYVKYQVPTEKVKTVNLANYAYNKDLFSYNFDSATPKSIDLFSGAASVKYFGLNLDTATNTQVTNGVKSSVENNLLGVNLDIDNIIGKAYGMPSGLSVNYSKSFGPLSTSIKGTLANLDLGATLSMSQDITAKVDSITGKLNLEDGSSLDYKVGDELTLSLEKYDKNKDGKLSLNYDFTKNGILANKTSINVKTNAGFELLDGSVSGKAKFSGATILDLNYNLGPAYSGNLPLTSNSFTVFDKSWNTAIGTGISQLVLV